MSVFISYVPFTCVQCHCIKLCFAMLTDDRTALVDGSIKRLLRNSLIYNQSKICADVIRIYF